MNMIGNGQETPASCPSIKSCTSLHGELPYKAPAVLSNVFAEEERTFVYQNSSVDCPQAWRETTARLIFCGNVYATDAFCWGIENALPWLDAESLADMGKMLSAVAGESGTVKNVAVNVVLYIPV